jgi:hypothetical protein
MHDHIRIMARHAVGYQVDDATIADAMAEHRATPTPALRAELDRLEASGPADRIPCVRIALAARLVI